MYTYVLASHQACAGLEFAYGCLWGLESFRVAWFEVVVRSCMHNHMHMHAHVLCLSLHPSPPLLRPGETGRDPPGDPYIDEQLGFGAGGRKDQGFLEGCGLAHKGQLITQAGRAVYPRIGPRLKRSASARTGDAMRRPKHSTAKHWRVATASIRF